MANFISSIEGLKIHDASAIHDISANKRSYAVTIGNPNSALSSSKQIDIPSDVNSILDNLTTNLILKDVSVTPDIDVYNKVEMDHVINAQNSSISLFLNLQGLVPEYDPYTIYTQNQLVLHDRHVYRCIVNLTTGLWNPSGWQETTLYDEIMDIRGFNVSGFEIVQIHADAIPDTSSLVGTLVVVHFEEISGRADESYTFDENCNISFSVEYGVQYTIFPGLLLGYFSPKNLTYTALLKYRNIGLQYKQINHGIFVIDNNGSEIDIDLWDPLNNINAKFIKFSNSTLCNDSVDNSIIIHRDCTQTEKSFQGKWILQNIDLLTVPNYSTAEDAKFDFNGYLNSVYAYNECLLPDASGKNKVDKYNESTGKAITINEYLPCISHCLNMSFQLGQETLQGYLPSLGQLYQIYLNLTDINNAMKKIGATPVDMSTYSIRDKVSSTEQDAGDIWMAEGGRVHYSNGDGKNYYNFYFLTLFKRL